MADDNRVQRDRAEYLSGGAAALAFVAIAAMRLWRAVGPVDMVAGVGFLALAAGLAVALATLYRRRRVARQARGRVAALRQERDLLRSARWWYLGPLVPGFLLVLGAGIAARPLLGIVVLAVIAGFFVWVDRQNRQAAEALDREIAAEPGAG